MRIFTFFTIFLVIYINGTAAARSRMPARPIKLYYLPPSPPCRAVMLLARVMGLELDLVLTNIMEGQHMTPEFLKMNPQHTIPTMDDNGFILWESRAIMAYLVNAYGRDDTLYPKNPRLRATVDSRLNFDQGTLFLRYYNLYMPMIFQGEEYNEENAAKLDEALGWLNSFLDGRAFVAGDNMTIADITMVVTLTNMDAFGYDFSAHENVTKWFERMKKSLEPYGYKDIDVTGSKILASFLKKD
ncbi:glutathione S-transferase 1-like [Leguminivora glycinivorella]|uniref:glutathione S-transferase 1-like n=1 Tax=Leguminivora glycinivorella TaxID=1035111 RepID=UPI0020102B4D|nr:glutathione S-transferase 1-like [Leguminivora glycinivorella]XP_048000285.1 glutathione S-transferase 1-like [Leguminivora glycinivorella]